MTKFRTHLLIIDPQNDFCDLPSSYAGADYRPSLPVAGAHADMRRVADLIDAAGMGIAEISVTLDSHQRIDIAHPTFWARGDGGAVTPFTQITAADVRGGAYVPRLAGALPRVLAYLDALEATGRYVHMVWPVHCEIGSQGHNVHDAVRSAYNRWEVSTLNTVLKVAKGANPWTEHYSAIRAEVPDADDPTTQTNLPFLTRLRAADQLYITGEAGSHCVKATTEHIVENLPRVAVERIALLTDCMSPVPGFEAQYQAFCVDMQTRGMRLLSAAEAGVELQANV